MKKNNFFVRGTLAGAFALVLALVFALILGGCENPTDGDSGPVYTVDFSLPAADKYSSLTGDWVGTGDQGNRFLDLEYHRVREAITQALWDYVNADGRGASGTIPAGTVLTMTRDVYNGKTIRVLSGSWSKTGWDTVNAGNAGTVTEFVTGKFEVVNELTSDTDGSGRSFKVQPGSKYEIKETNTRTYAARVGGTSGRGERTSETGIRERGNSFIVTDASYTVNVNNVNMPVTRNGIMRKWEKEHYNSATGSSNTYTEERWVSDKAGKVWCYKTDTNERTRNALEADW